MDYLLIESRDPFDGPGAERCYDLARELARRRNRVVLFLIQNGVLPARRGARNAALLESTRAGVSVRADEFSLRERGIAPDRLAAGVEPAPISAIVDALADGAKVIWH